MYDRKMLHHTKCFLSITVKQSHLCLKPVTMSGEQKCLFIFKSFGKEKEAVGDGTFAGKTENCYSAILAFET